MTENDPNPSKKKLSSPAAASINAWIKQVDELNKMYGNRNPSTEEFIYSGETEIESLLDMADSLQNEVDRKIERLSRVTTALFLVPATILVSLTGLIYIFNVYDRIEISALLMFVLLAVLLVYGLVFFRVVLRAYRNAKVSYYRDANALGRVLNILSECMENLIESESLSPIKRAEYEVKMSRYIVSDRF